MSCVKDLKLHQVRKLDGAYYVQRGLNIGNKIRNANIFYYNKEQWQRATKQFILADEDHIFTTKAEAFAYCTALGITVNEEVIEVKERS